MGNVVNILIEYFNKRTDLKLAKSEVLMEHL